PQTASPGRARLSTALRGSLVDGSALGRLFAGRFAQTLQAHLQGEICRVQDPVRSETDARSTYVRARMALCGGAAHGRGHASVDPHGGRAVRQGVAEPER